MDSDRYVGVDGRVVFGRRFSQRLLIAHAVRFCREARLAVFAALSAVLLDAEEITVPLAQHGVLRLHSVVSECLSDFTVIVPDCAWGSLLCDINLM